MKSQGVELKVGDNYRINLYKKLDNGIHVFENENHRIYVKDSWIINREGLITYSPASSVSIGIFEKESAQDE